MYSLLIFKFVNNVVILFPDHCHDTVFTNKLKTTREVGHVILNICEIKNIKSNTQYRPES